MTKLMYVSDFDIPEEVIAAERLLSDYFLERNIAGWVLGRSCSREFYETWRKEQRQRLRAEMVDFCRGKPE